MSVQAQALNGTCMCGACRFTATPQEQGSGACHCGMCRRWTGGIFLSVSCGQSVVFDADAPLGRYRGSEWGERVFCKECGSNLLWQTQDGAHQNVSIQAFDHPEDFPLTQQIFIDRKPSSYALAGETHNMTEAEVFAMFAPKEGSQ